LNKGHGIEQRSQKFKVICFQRMVFSEDESENSDGEFFDVEELQKIVPVQKGLNWNNEIAECSINEYQVI